MPAQPAAANERPNADHAGDEDDWLLLRFMRAGSRNQTRSRPLPQRAARSDGSDQAVEPKGTSGTETRPQLPPILSSRLSAIDCRAEERSEIHQALGQAVEQYAQDPMSARNRPLQFRC